jgi:hypothetical protein
MKGILIEEFDVFLKDIAAIKKPPLARRQMRT